MTFLPARLCGTVDAPASKSEAHRRMICAGLSYGETVLSRYMASEDMEATRRCLHALGSDSVEGNGTLTVRGHVLPTERVPVLDCGESGSTLRFFVPIALTLTGGGVFRMHGRLGSRPMDVYRDMFVPRGVRWQMGIGPDGAAELSVVGKMDCGDYVLPGNVSSQFVSGLLFALPMLPGPSTLCVRPPVESADYILMTIQALRNSGIQVEEVKPFHWSIPGNQSYRAVSGPLEGDYSQAAVLLCAGALGHAVRVTHLPAQTTQGDRAVLEYLRALGAQVREDAEGICVTAEALHGAVLDMRNCPDIAPMLALVCQLAEGESRLVGCGRLRLKECDRLATTVELLSRLGGNIRTERDDMIIRGMPGLRGNVTLDSQKDHRMVMLASIAATLADGPVCVQGVEALGKSWPDYLRVYQQLGGKVE